MKAQATGGWGGWTFVEMLVAVSLSAVFMGAAALVFGSITANSKRLTTVLDVNIGVPANQNFYGQSGDTVSVYSAPSYGKAAYAQEFRDLIREDTEYASGVYCLPRVLANTIRPEFLRYFAGDPGSTLPPPRLDTPEAFRAFLASVEPTSAAIYDTAIRNVPNAARPNTSLYILSPETDPGYIRVRAVYEIDFLTPTNMAGTYASVRRYKNNTLTHYYDIFYEAGPGTPLYPSFIAFERSARSAVSEGTAIDRFKVAGDNPFYFLWLPDPAINPNKVATGAAVAPASSPLAAYEFMGAKSSFHLVLPMFPGL